MAKKQSKTKKQSEEKKQGKKVANPHDAFFKNTFSYPDVARIRPK